MVALSNDQEWQIPRNAVVGLALGVPRFLDAGELGIWGSKFDRELPAALAAFRGSSVRRLGLLVRCFRIIAGLGRFGFGGGGRSRRFFFQPAPGPQLPSPPCPSRPAVWPPCWREVSGRSRSAPSSPWRRHRHWAHPKAASPPRRPRLTPSRRAGAVISSKLALSGDLSNSGMYFDRRSASKALSFAIRALRSPHAGPAQRQRG